MKKRIITILVVSMFCITICIGCKVSDKSTNKVDNNTQSDEIKTSNDGNKEFNIENTDNIIDEENKKDIDIKDYSDILTEDLGGNLAETLADLLSSEVSYNEKDMLFHIEGDKLQVGASSIRDGYFVWLYSPINGFKIYGIEPGMTIDEANSILLSQGISKGEYDNYYIDDRKYITLDVASDGILEKVSFWHYLGQ